MYQMSSKTISVSSDLLGGYFKPKSGNSIGSRATRRNRGKTIPKQQILNEMRAAQHSIMKDASSLSTTTNPPPLTMDTFEESRNFFRKETKINEKHKRPMYPQSTTPNPRMAPLPMTVQQPTLQPQSQTTLHLPPPSYKLVTTPRFGCLKQGILPTYRSFKSQNHHSSINSVSPTTLRTDNLDEKLMVSAAEKTQSLREMEAKEAKEAKSNNTDTERVTKSNLPPATKTVLCSRKYTLGKRHNADKVGVLISGSQHRETLKKRQCEVKQLPMMELREKLAKRGIVHTTTTAPRNLLQNMYENSCINICGELNII